MVEPMVGRDVVDIEDEFELQHAAKRHCRHQQNNSQSEEGLDGPSSDVKLGLEARRQTSPIPRPSSPSPRHPLAGRLVMMWHTHEHRLLAQEESPTIEELDAFMQEHPEIELYDGQDRDSAEACSSCATPPAGSDASTHSEEEVPDADLSALEPCLTRITVKICYGDEELLLTTNTMCFPLLR